MFKLLVLNMLWFSEVGLGYYIGLIRFGISQIKSIFFYSKLHSTGDAKSYIIISSKNILAEQFVSVLRFKAQYSCQ